MKKILLPEQKETINKKINALEIENAVLQVKINASNGIEKIAATNLYNQNARAIDPLCQLLQNSIIASMEDSDTIKIGSTFDITLDYGDNDIETCTLTLVDIIIDEQPDTHITTSSPLGAAVMGKMENDNVIYDGPFGKIIGTINSIHKKAKTR